MASGPNLYPDQPKRRNYASYIPLVLFAIGIIFIVMQFALNAKTYLEAYFWKVNHPTTYNFQQYDHLLHDYVQNGLVDYRILKHSANLASSVTELSHTAPDKLDSNSQLAFWINAYNLLVIQNIVDHYPLNTITPLEESTNLHKFMVGGKPYSLENIESDELKPRLTTTNSELVFLLCGGSLGFPTLINHAITAESMASDAAASAANFISNKDNINYDPKIKVLFLSPFFKWHENLFSSNDKKLVWFINNHLSDEDKIPFDFKRSQIIYKSTFNWYLNDTILATH